MGGCYLGKVNEIEYRSPRDIRSQMYDMLCYWRQEHLPRYETLCDVLIDEGRIATAGITCYHYTCTLLCQPFLL